MKKEHGAKFCDKLYKLYKSMMPLDIRGDVDMSEWELDMSDRMRAKLLAYYQDYQKEPWNAPPVWLREQRGACSDARRPAEKVGQTACD